MKTAARIVIVCVLIGIALIAFLQAGYLSSADPDGEIRSIEFYSFSGEPYYSRSVLLGTVTDPSVLASVRAGLDRQDVCSAAEEKPLAYAEICFTTGRIVSCAVYDGRVSLDYGHVWLSCEEMSSLANDFLR